MADGGGNIPVDPRARHKDLLVRAVSQAVATHDVGRREAALKAIVTAAWKMMSPASRKAFMRAVGLPPEYSLMEFRKRWPDLNDRDLELAARNWGYINDLDGDERGFHQSITKNLRFKDFTPSAKQIRWMKQIYKEFLRWQDLDSDDVIQKE